MIILPAPLSPGSPVAALTIPLSLMATVPPSESATLKLSTLAWTPKLPALAERFIVTCNVRVPDGTVPSGARCTNVVLPARLAAVVGPS